MLTVGDVAALPGLGLVVAAGSGGLQREVRWVASAELVDPTPFLEGGELLLTTGLALDDEEPVLTAYVERLVARDVAGLGFGVGLRHAALPARARRRRPSASGCRSWRCPTRRRSSRSRRPR